MEGTRVRRGKSERKARVEPARTRVEERSGGERRRRTRGKIGRSDRGPAETKGVRAICWIVGYRHPEVALIEIMIGGPMVGAARQRGRKGKSELGNERTWPSGSALSRKPSRRSGPIKRPPSLPPLSLSLSLSLSSSGAPTERDCILSFQLIFQYGRRRQARVGELGRWAIIIVILFRSSFVRSFPSPLSNFLPRW